MELNAESNRSVEGLQLRLAKMSIFLRFCSNRLEWKLEDTSGDRACKEPKI